MFGVETMQQADLATQERILRRGVELINEWTSVDVIAHRAGGYWADLDTITACQRVNIPLELSYNAQWASSELSQAGLTVNAPFVRQGILCVPVTSYIQASVGNWQSRRFLDIEGSSPQEIRTVVSQLHSHGVRTATVMGHSFSFTRGGKQHPRIANALDTLLGDLVADRNVKVVTVSQLYDVWRNDRSSMVGRDYLPTTGLLMTYSRAWHRLGEGWKNIVVAIGPPACTLAAAIVTALIWRRRRRNAQQANALRLMQTQP